MHAAWLVQVYDPTPTELTNRWLVSRTTFSCSFLFFRTSLKMHPAFFFHSEYLNNKRKPTEKNLFHPDCVNFLINSDRERKEEKRFLLRYYPNLPNNPPKTNSISGRDNMGRRRREEWERHRELNVNGKHETKFHYWLVCLFLPSQFKVGIVEF